MSEKETTEQNNVNELLEKVFENINSWLNFAEAKNAANIALVVAMIAAIFSLDTNWWIVCILVVFVMSGILSLITFIPKMGTVFMNKNKKKQNPNLLYFGDIYVYSGDEYLFLVYKEYIKKGKLKYDKYEKDLADEIVYNSAVAMMKYTYFKFAVKLDIVAFVVLVVEILLSEFL